MSTQVSVIIPAYNMEKYIAKAIESVLDQTIQDFEIVVIDDGSTDRTVNVIEGFQDVRIRVIRHTRNKGVSNSRNEGVLGSKGKWIAILDADDWWAPDRLEKLLNAARLFDSPMICDDLGFVKDGDESPFTTFLTSRVKVFGRIDQPCFLTAERLIKKDFGFLKPIFRKDVLMTLGLRYDEDLHHSEDFKFMAEWLCSGQRLLLLPDPLYFYRRRSNSLSSPDSYQKQLRGNQTHIKICEQLMFKYGENKNLKKALKSRILANKVKIAELDIEQNLKDKRYIEAVKEVLSQPAVLRPLLRNMKNKMF